MSLSLSLPTSIVPNSSASDDSPRGCGWFDSSHELLTGLSITELDSPDRVANDLALDVWLVWHLAGQAPRRPACASSGF